MAEISWTAEAERWLKDIYDFIADDNPDAAFNVLEGIYETVQLLQQFPELGYRYEPVPQGTSVFCFTAIIGSRTC